MENVNARRQLKYQENRADEAVAQLKKLENNEHESLGVSLKQQLAASENRVCELEEENLALQEGNACKFKREGKLFSKLMKILCMCVCELNDM